MQVKSWQSFCWVGSLLLSLILAGCGDDYDYASSSTATDTESTVSGVAAAGAPLIGWVTLADSEGAQRGPVKLGLDGSFSLDVEGLVPPFFLLADGKAGFSDFHLHHIARASGTNNVNPVSDLVAKAATDGKINDILPEGAADPELDVAGENPADVLDTETLQGALDEAVAAFQTMLQPLLDLFDATIDDYLSKTFVADSTGADLMFDVVKVEVSQNGGLFNISNKTDGSVIKTGDLQLDAIKNAPPIDETVAASVKEVKTDMEEIGPFLSEWLTTIKGGVATWLKDQAAAGSDSILIAAADQAFIDKVSPLYTDASSFGFNDGFDLEIVLYDWLEDFDDTLEINGLSNLAVVEKKDDGTYLLTANIVWGETNALETLYSPIAVVKDGTDWKVTGNGYLIDPDICGNTERTHWTDGPYSDIAGFDMNVNTYDPDVAYAIVSGPGFPAGGLELTADMVLGNEFSFDGYYVFPNGVGLPYLYVPGDIASLPAISTYTWEVYDSTDALLQTIYSVNDARPLDLDTMSAAEKDALFSTIDNIGERSLAWMDANLNGSEFVFEYTPPQVTTVDFWGDVGFGYQWVSGMETMYDWNWIDFYIDQDAQTATATITLPAGSTFNWGRITLGSWKTGTGDIEATYDMNHDSTGSSSAAM